MSFSINKKNSYLTLNKVSNNKLLKKVLVNDEKGVL